MSKFTVTIEKIKTVNKHPNADRLDIVSLDGKNYQLITQKGLYKPKDKVVYFPVDSVMPQDLIERFGLSYLHGANKNRVKTAKLRGSISQGIVVKATDFKFGKMKIGTEVNELLGITKYEPIEVNSGKHTKLSTLPDGVFYYDLENAQNHPEVIRELMQQDFVYIEEKLEGTHFVFSYLPDTDEFDVCSRRMKVNIESVTYYDDNPYWKVALDKGYLDYIRSISSVLKSEGKNHQRITLRGELLGGKIQNNIYSLENYDVYFFELELDSMPVDRVTFYTMMYDFNLKHAPCIFSGKLNRYLDGKDLSELSNGFSLLNSKQLREGIVIRPSKEFNIMGFGRAIIKQRSPEYLANSDL